MTSSRGTITQRLVPVRDLAIDEITEPVVGRHRQVDEPPVWNNSTMVVQVIRDALVGMGLSVRLEPSRVEGPAPELARRPLDFGSGWWR